MQRKSLGIINVDFDATDELLIINSAFAKYLRKNGNTMKQCISSLYTSYSRVWVGKNLSDMFSTRNGLKQ